MPTSTALQREFLQITQESSFGVMAATPTRGTNQIAIRLPGSNQFTMRPNPVVQPMPYGGGFQVIADTVSDKQECRGQLSTPLAYSQAKFLLDWASTRVSSGTIPWTTTEVAGQFASCTIDHAIMYDDTGAVKRTRYTGCKVDKWKFDISDESQYGTLQLDLIGSNFEGNTFDSSTDPTATDFPIPLDTDFPTDFILWVHSGGGLTIGSATRTEYTTLSLSGDNQSDVRYYATRILQVIRSYGTMFSVDSDITLVSTPDDRAALIYITAQPITIVFSGGTHSVTLAYHGNNRIKGLTDDTQLGKIFGRKLSLENRYDRTAGAYFGFTYT